MRMLISTAAESEGDKHAHMRAQHTHQGSHVYAHPPLLIMFASHPHTTFPSSYHRIILDVGKSHESQIMWLTVG